MRGARAAALLAIALAGAAAWSAFARADSDPDAGPEADARPAPARDAGAGAANSDRRARAAFADVYAVLASPRCANCHPADGVPRQRDDARPHSQNISRRSPDSGLPCTTCHRHQNAPIPGGPPGVHDWRMPPAETPMAFRRRSPRQLCEQLKTPAKTGGRDLDDLIEHVATDHFVLWAWEPGPGRSEPPISHEAFVGAVTTWVGEGAACPTDGASPGAARDAAPAP